MNILLIITDQQFAGAMSCTGNPDLHTPAMDRLAAAGTRFDAAYCTYPLCIPARESMLTGRMPMTLGYRKWGDAIDPKFERQQLGWIFRDAGYRCAHAGKLHAPGWDPTPHGFENLCGHNDHQLPDACINFLQQKHDQPFLLVASFDNPHNICEWARGQNLPWGNVPDVPIDQCPPLPANFAIPPDEPQAIRIIQSRAPTIYPMANASPDQWRRYRHAYFRLVEKADAGIDRILTALHDAGHADDTLIVFTSDHGDGHGAHQWNQKSILYEECIRIPFIVTHPTLVAAGRVDAQHLVSNGLDLLPTLCDLANVQPPPDLPGHSLRPLLQPDAAHADASPAWRDELVIETHPHQGDPALTLGRCLRTARHKYVVYTWGQPREQLIDLQRDPGEMINLATHAGHRDLLHEHRARLRAWCKVHGDDFLRHIPEDTV